MSYLRQPSPLTFEPLKPSASEIEASGSGSDESSNYHKAKRRRVEDLGRQYLAGRTLFIQSASLRGPFDDGWVIPWKNGERGKWKPGFNKGNERLPGKELADQVVKPGPKDEHGAGYSRPYRHSGTGGAEEKLRCVDKPSTTPRIPGLAARPNRTAQEQVELERREQRRIRKEEQACKAALLQRDGFGKTAEQAVDLTGPFQLPHQDTSPRTMIAANEWLKSDEDYVQERLREEPRSPTPTPTSRPDDKRALSRPYPEPHTPTLNASRTAPVASARLAGFTPINIPSRTLVPVHHQEYQRKKRTSRSPLSTPMTAKRRKSIRPKVCQQGLIEAGAVAEVEGQRTKELLYEPALNAGMVYLPAVDPPSETGELADKTSSAKSSATPAQGDRPVPKKASLSNVVRESTPATRTLPSMNTKTDRSSVQHSDTGQISAVPDRVPITRNISHSSPSDAKGMLQAVPPSTNMSEFRYRRAPKITDNKQPTVGEASVEPSAFEIEKVKKPRRMDFPSSGDPLTRQPVHTSADGTLQQWEGSAGEASASQRGGDCSSILIGKLPETSIASEKQALLQHQADDISRISSVFQEAQVVPNQSGNLPQAPSAPSTDLMETDKQSLHFGTENDDSNVHLSTQAAIAKAQLSFRADIASPIKQSSLPSSPARDAIGSFQDSVSHVVPTGHGITPFRTFHTPSPDTSTNKIPAPSSADEPMSTQEMIDAVTPFAFSTIKKPRTKKRISFGPSPIGLKHDSDSDDVNEEFGKSGLDMETSPEPLDQANKGTHSALEVGRGPSNGVSAAHSLSLPSSFSIAPNGTLKEVFQQDGQVNGAMMDLNAVVDDVGSFLQSWDLEAELKKNTGPSTVGSTKPSSRSSTGMRSGREMISRSHHHL